MKIAAKVGPLLDAASRLRPLARWGTRAAVPTTGLSGFDLVSKPDRPRSWTLSLPAAALLAGAAIALGGCELKQHQETLVAVGSAASGIHYPVGPRFLALPAAEAATAFDAASRAANQVTTLGVAKTRDFTAAEIAELNHVVDQLRPLWRCSEAPLDHFIRVDYLLDGKELTDQVAGVAYSHAKLIAIADSAHTTDWSFRAVGVHEVAHKLLQNLDPRTCKVYPDHYKNPLVQEWMETMGWKDAKTFVAPNVASTFNKEMPCTKYGLKSPLEDMADALVCYAADRKAAQRMSPRRVAFYDALYEKLGASPPTGLHDSNMFVGETWNVRGDRSASPTDRIFQIQLKAKDSDMVFTLALESNGKVSFTRDKIS